MIDESFKKVCKLSDLKLNEGKRFIINETEIAIFKIEETIYALSNICPHQHSALIYDGFIEDDAVVCPAHGWKFDLKTGKMPNGGKGLDSYRVKIENDDVYVQVQKKKYNW